MLRPAPASSAAPRGSVTRRLRRSLATVASLAATAFTLGCNSGETVVPNVPSNPFVETYASATGVVIANMTRVNANLYIQDVTVGSGAEATAGKTVEMRYTGMLVNGSKFDSNEPSGPLLTFPLGTGYVIPGWDQGLVGMKVGGKRKLVIGSALAYQNQSPDPRVIPQNATLVFDVTLVAVR
ncbi:MAG: FKBP-type peptidyl-prolyl cis-trans isomerase [Gemmatimonadetes bacterium]|nr:FKBP-type peptidyl-prolyl cis-trans isomerase [Gemmatimonadota bacterium]